MRWHTSKPLHAHTAGACVQACFAALSSWRQQRKDDPDAKLPHKRKWYFRIECKRSAMKLIQGTLQLSNGQGKAPLVLPWLLESFRTRWSFAGRYVSRWNIEVTFLRSPYPFRARNAAAMEYACHCTDYPCLLGLFSFVVLLTHALHPDHLPTRQAAWYPKAESKIW